MTPVYSIEFLFVVQINVNDDKRFLTFSGAALYNGNRTELSPVQSVMVCITKYSIPVGLHAPIFHKGERDHVDVQLQITSCNRTAII